MKNFFNLLTGKSKKKFLIKSETGVIYHPHSLEIQVVDHCNLTCTNCNHLSPIMPKRFESAEDIVASLKVLKNFYCVHRIKLIGGEPLLHPDIENIAHAIRLSGICDKIMLVTNGTLLPKITDGLLQLIDEIEISQYPSSVLPQHTLEQFKKRAEHYLTKVTVLYYPTFQNSFAFKGTENKNLIQRIFNTCRKVQLWGCYTIYKGYFFKCPQSMYLSLIIPQLQDDIFGDGLKIQCTEDFPLRFYAFLTSPHPLKACQFCVGNVGYVEKHGMVERENWSERHELTTEEIVDQKMLKRAEKDFTLGSECRTETKFKDKRR